jgi:hypothetical protein
LSRFERYFQVAYIPETTRFHYTYSLVTNHHRRRHHERRQRNFRPNACPQILCEILLYIKTAVASVQDFDVKSAKFKAAFWFSGDVTHISVFRRNVVPPSSGFLAYINC